MVEARLGYIWTEGSRKRVRIEAARMAADWSLPERDLRARYFNRMHRSGSGRHMT